MTENKNELDDKEGQDNVVELGAETTEASKEEGSLNATQIAEYQNQIAELNDKVLRSAAEIENMKRRTEREKTDALKYGISKFAKELLTVADNLSRALQSIPEENRKDNQMLADLYMGVEATQKDLLKAFDKMGIRPIDSLGKAFDPHFHQVVFEDEESTEPSGTITQELQTGYMIEDRLLREAMVGVSKNKK
jgi:molecular chaperone GrpE